MSVKGVAFHQSVGVNYGIKTANKCAVCEDPIFNKSDAFVIGTGKKAETMCRKCFFIAIDNYPKELMLA